MGATNFHTFTKDNGLPVEVEYEIVSYGEPHFDSPGHICDGGGSGPEVQINDSWPNTPEFNSIAKQQLFLSTSPLSPMNASQPLYIQAYGRVRFIWLGIKEAWQKRKARLTDDERWRWEAVIAELYVDEGPEFDEGDWRDLER
jgi:hypothetical protein